MFAAHLKIPCDSLPCSHLVFAGLRVWEGHTIADMFAERLSQLRIYEVCYGGGGRLIVKPSGFW